MSEQTPNLQPAAETNPVTRESVPEPTSFRQRKLQQMASEGRLDVESDRMSNLNQVEPPQREPQQLAHQPDHRDQQPELETLEEPSGYPEDEPTGDPDAPGVELTPNPDVDLPPMDSVDWEAKYTEAEELRGNMQSDYQRKTQKLADDRREMKKGFDVQTQVSQAYVDNAERALQQWQGVDWQQLRRTLDPADYNQRVQQYQQVANQVDQAKSNHQALNDFATKQIDDQKAAEAEVSRDILRNTIPKWGNEVYGSLRNYAMETLGYTQTEFDDITDHKMVALIHRDWQRTNAGKHVQNVTRSNNQTPPRGGNLPQRSADGKFRNTKKTWLENPGERGAARNHFQEKLRREREGR